MSSGINAQLGVVAETSYGQAVTVTRFYPLVNESVVREISRLESAGIIKGANVIRSAQWSPGLTRVSGDLGLEWYQQNTGLLFEHMLGAVTSTTAGGVSTHTVTPGDLSGKSLTAQIGRPATNGTVYPFTYAGVKVASWEVAVAADEIATLGLSIVAQTESQGVSLATASYTAGYERPFTYMHGAVSVSGSSICVRSLSVRGDNMLSTDRVCIGQSYIDQPLAMDLRTYEGTATLEFSDTTMYSRFVGGLEAPIVLSMSSSATAQATLTLNARFDGVTPNVASRDLLVVEVPFKCVASTTQDSSAIQLVLKNIQTTA